MPSGAHAPCQLAGCGARSYRRCKVCLRWACRNCRAGSGWWVRCYECSHQALVELRRSHAEQLRDERAFECAVCGRPFAESRADRGVYRPSCDCHQLSSPRQRFNGL